MKGEVWQGGGQLQQSPPHSSQNTRGRGADEGSKRQRRGPSNAGEETRGAYSTKTGWTWSEDRDGDGGTGRCPEIGRGLAGSTEW